MNRVTEYPRNQATHPLCHQCSAYSPTKRAVSFYSLVWVVLTITTSCEAYVCVHPTTAWGQVSLETLVRLRGPSGGYGTTLSLCLPPTSKRTFPSNCPRKNNVVRVGTKTSLSMSKLNDFTKRLRDWKTGIPGLRLSPRFIARLRRTVKALSHRQKSRKEMLGSGINKENELCDTTVVSTDQGEPNGPRWAITTNTDLSGEWKPIVTQKFKKDYDSYLVKCGQNFMFRQVIVNGIGLQKEYITQKHQGRDLEIYATNPAGNWNRTLKSSGADLEQDTFEAMNTTIRDPDGDMVQVESWWEENGIVHKSWLRGKPRLHGGEIETARYLESNDTLVTTSTFHPGLSKFEYANITWRFKRIERKHIV